VLFLKTKHYVSQAMNPKERRGVPKFEQKLDIANQISAADTAQTSFYVQNLRSLLLFSNSMHRVASLLAHVKQKIGMY